MQMQTVAQKAFFAQFDGEAGVLVKPDKELLFFNQDTRQYVSITPENIHRLVRLGEVSQWMSVYFDDLARARQERRSLAA
jgi:hypothetical protein